VGLLLREQDCTFCTSRSSTYLLHIVRAGEGKTMLDPPAQHLTKTMNISHRRTVCVCKDVDEWRGGGKGKRVTKQRKMQILRHTALCGISFATQLHPQATPPLPPVNLPTHVKEYRTAGGTYSDH
jgi:hypothetical protein